MSRLQLVRDNRASGLRTDPERGEAFHLGAGELPSSWCTVRFVQVADDVWVGVAPSSSSFVEHVRISSSCVAMGTVLGRALCIDGRAAVLDEEREAFGVGADALHSAATRLRARHPLVDTVTVVFRAQRIREQDPADDARGAIPRT
jgi:hypothetical protein